MNNEAIIELLNDIQTSVNLSPENINILSDFKSLIERDEYKDDDIKELFQIICGKDINEVIQIIRNQNDQAVTNQSLELIKKFINDLSSARDFFAGFIADNYKDTPCIEITKTLKEKLSRKGFFTSNLPQNYNYDDRLNLYLYHFVSRNTDFLMTQPFIYDPLFLLTPQQLAVRDKYSKNIKDPLYRFDVIMNIADYFCQKQMSNFIGFKKLTGTKPDIKTVKLYFHYFLEYLSIINVKKQAFYADFLKKNAYELLIYFERSYLGKDPNNLNEKFDFILNKTNNFIKHTQQIKSIASNERSVQKICSNIMMYLPCDESIEFLFFIESIVTKIETIKPGLSVKMLSGARLEYIEKLYRELQRGQGLSKIEKFIKMLIFCHSLDDETLYLRANSEILALIHNGGVINYKAINKKLISDFCGKNNLHLPKYIAIVSISICASIIISIFINIILIILTVILTLLNFYLFYNLYSLKNIKAKIDSAAEKAEKSDVQLLELKPVLDGIGDIIYDNGTNINYNIEAKNSQH